MFEERITVDEMEKDVFEVNVEYIDEDDDLLEETFPETGISEDDESETCLWANDSECDEDPDMVSVADFTYEGNTSEDAEEGQESWANKEGIDRVTSHGADVEVLAKFTARIQEHLRCGNQALALAGIELFKAKQALGRGEALSDEQEVTFTEWYQEELKISPDRARRLMRWVRPVIEDSGESASTDLILKELVEIGPCLFDEVQKLPESCWYFDCSGRLYISSEVTGEGDVAVRGMSVREVRSLQKRFNNPHNDDCETPDSPWESADLEDEPSEGSSEYESSDDLEDDEANDGDDHDYLAQPDDGSTHNNRPNEPGTNDRTSKHEHKRQNTSNLGRVDLSEAEPDLWDYGTSEVEKFTVVDGKLRVPSFEKGLRVYGVNVSFTANTDNVMPTVLDADKDAFYVLKDGDAKTINWFEHETGMWRSAQITSGSAQ